MLTIQGAYSQFSGADERASAWSQRLILTINISRTPIDINEKEDAMTVKIIIKRIVPEDKNRDLISLLKQLRNLSIQQPGYISGETLKNIENPNEVLVISTWQTSEDWYRWVQNEQRKALQSQIDTFLQANTEYGIYDFA